MLALHKIVKNVEKMNACKRILDATTSDEFIMLSSMVQRRRKKWSDFWAVTYGFRPEEEE